MTLPIDGGGVLWFVPSAVWEWEDEVLAAVPACAGTGTPELPAAARADDAETPNAQRLVFKGYTYATRYGWMPADSPLARPWERGQVDDADRRHRQPPVVKGDAVATGLYDVAFDRINPASPSGRS